MLSCTRGVVKGGRLLSASSTRPSSSSQQQQLLIARGGLWSSGAEFGLAKTAASVSTHERRRFATTAAGAAAAAGGEAVPAAGGGGAAPPSSAAAGAAVVAAALAGAALSSAGGEEEEAEDGRQDNNTKNSSTPGAVIANAAAGGVGLLARPRAAECGGQRKIQDMYHMVDSPIGQGAFGVVCAGVHKVTGEVVAVKQIPRRLMTTPRLQAEVDLLRMAGQHKNVVGFRDLFSDRNFYYIVMEFATGGELFDRLVTKGAHSEHDAASLLREVVHAVAYLHGHSIIHFDIKPENILLHDADADDLDVRLVDFGSAFVVGETGESGPKNDSGTIAYSAPEVLRGQPVSTAADMWSLGVVLYILLSGFHPFDLEGGANDAEVRKKVLSRDLTFDKSQWAGKEGAVDLINKLLDSDPRRRPTAEEVLEHPWMQKTANLSRRPMVHAAENLRGFHRGRMRLKACLLAVMSGLAGPETYDDPASTVGSRTGALKWMDVGGKDYISAADLRRAMRLLGESISDQEILRMIQASTGHPAIEQDSGIVYEDFMKLVPPLCPTQIFKGGSTIYTEGEIDRNFYLINQGEVSLELEGAAPKQGLKLWGRRNGKSEEEGDKFAIKLERLGRGSSFGESELLAAAEAEEGAAALAAALKDRQNSHKLQLQQQTTRALQQQQLQQQQQQQQPQSENKPVAMLVSAAGVEGNAGGVEPSLPSPRPLTTTAITPRKKSAPGEGPGRGAARGGGVARAARAVCVSEEDCEVMAVPRHLFANLLDELGGVRRKLELQAKERATSAINRLLDDKALPGSRLVTVPASAAVWPKVQDQEAPPVDGGAAGGSGSGGVPPPEPRRMSKREPPTVLLVREGSAVVTMQDGTKTTVRPGEVFVCGVPRRGIPRVVRVTSADGGDGTTVVEVPLHSFRKGGLFASSAALDAFLRVLNVGFSDINE